MRSATGRAAERQRVDNASVKVRAAAVVVFLAIQVTTPVLIWFTQPRPARFAWEMFAETPPAPSVVLVFEDGTYELPSAMSPKPPTSAGDD